MGALFGKTKKPQSKITEQDKAVLQLKQQRDKLKQYQKRIENSLERDRLIAKKCLQTGRKERAKLLLRKKKYQEKLLENTDVQLENLEKLAADIEFAQVEQKVLDGLKTGNAALKKVHDILDIGEIERVLDETREGVEKQQEIDDILSGVLTSEEEDSVMAELDALVEEEESLKNLEKIPEEDIEDKLPDVPTEHPEAKKTRVREAEKKILIEA